MTGTVTDNGTDQATAHAADRTDLGRRDAVTLRAVALHAGVSKSVVSRVLQGAPHVSELRRRKVEDAIRELGYRPNSAARSLAQRRTRAIGVLVNDLKQPWFIDFLQGLHSTLHQHGLHAFIGDGRLDLALDENLMKAFMEMRVDGLVLAGTMPISDTVREAVGWLPTVVAGSRDFYPDGVDVAAEDDWLAAELALDHLHGLGHRRIHHIAGQQGRVLAIRRESYESWMAAHGLTRNARVADCDTTEKGAYEAALELLDVRPEDRPTAIFAANDLVAVGALGAARTLGLDVPRDLSLVGVDNSVLARMRHTWLTSVDVAAQRVGEVAAQLLVQRIADPTVTAREHLETPWLEVRGSTTPPASD